MKTLLPARKTGLFLLLALGLLLSAIILAKVPGRDFRQIQSEPWNESQLMKPSVLAGMIQKKSPELPLLVCIGPAASIPGSLDFGPGQEQSNLVKMRTGLASQDKNKSVVIYCGCCPFKNCPNVRPAFRLLKDLGFKKPYLLNLSTNMKTDWIDKGFPVVQ
jgi:hypothetical protein